MAGVNDNLIPAKKGEVRNPKGKAKGTPNRKTILNFLMFEADINEMGIIQKKPAWWDKVKPKTLYEMMTLAQGIKAASGDTQAYSALNKAMGELHIHEGGDKPVAILGGTSVSADDSPEQDTGSAGE